MVTSRNAARRLGKPNKEKMMEQEKLVDIANSLSNEDLCHLISMLADRFDVYYGCHNKVILSAGVEFACPLSRS